jgi:hypothetical protein
LAICSFDALAALSLGLAAPIAVAASDTLKATTKDAISAAEARCCNPLKSTKLAAICDYIPLSAKIFPVRPPDHATAGCNQRNYRKNLEDRQKARHSAHVSRLPAGRMPPGIVRIYVNVYTNRCPPAITIRF